MKKYVIKRDYGYAGRPDADLVEAESLEDAQEMAWEWAIQRVDSWAEEYDPEEHDGQL